MTPRFFAYGFLYALLPILSKTVQEVQIHTQKNLQEVQTNAQKTYGVAQANTQNIQKTGKEEHRGVVKNIIQHI